MLEEEGRLKYVAVGDRTSHVSTHLYSAVGDRWFHVVLRSIKGSCTRPFKFCMLCL